MFESFIGKRVSVIVSTRGDNVIEYTGVLSSEMENALEMTNVDISYLMLNYQRGFFGNGISQYKTGVGKVVINKNYIISCNE